MSTTVVPARIAHSPDRIERYSFVERICHWVTSFAYMYCLATGLAFYSPHLFWMTVVLGGGATGRFWHPVLGMAFFAGALWMHGLWRNSMALTTGDKKWLREDTKLYATNQDALMPPQAKYNGGQKVYYWAMFYASFFLVLSGLVLWFPERIPPGLSWLRGVAILTHVSAALVTIGAFMVHVYMSVFMVPGSMSAMLTGYVSRAWAKSHHRLWYEQATGNGPKT